MLPKHTFATSDADTRPQRKIREPETVKHLSEELACRCLKLFPSMYGDGSEGFAPAWNHGEELEGGWYF